MGNKGSKRVEREFLSVMDANKGKIEFGNVNARVLRRDSDNTEEPEEFRPRMDCSFKNGKLIFTKVNDPQRGEGAMSLLFMCTTKEGIPVMGSQLSDITPKDAETKQPREDLRVRIQIIVDIESNRIDIWNCGLDRNNASTRRVYGYRIYLPSKSQTVKPKMKQLLDWHSVFNTDKFRGATIMTKAAREKLDQQEKLAREEEERVAREAAERIAREEREEQERLARIEDERRRAREEQERIAARKLRLKRNKELLQQAVEPARLERIRKQAQDKGMAAVFLSRRNMPARVEEKGTSNPDNPTDLRRLAENDSMETVFSMLWILPLLVIFVFWFKRYIVTRKNNDDNVIVQDNVKEEENDLSKFV